MSCRQSEIDDSIANFLTVWHEADASAEVLKQSPRIDAAMLSEHFLEPQMHVQQLIGSLPAGN